MNKEAFLLGYPQSFKGKFLVYPPKVRDMIGNQDFQIGFKELTISQEEIEDLITEATEKNPQIANQIDKSKSFPTPMELMLGNCYRDKNHENKIKECFQILIHQEVSFLYDAKKILIGNFEEVIKKSNSLDDFICITEEEYFDFQNFLRQAIGDKVLEAPKENEDPRVKRMKAKARYRDRIKAKTGKGISFFTQLTSICCMGIGITPLNIGEMSYVAVGALTSRYQEKEKYETDIRSLQAGADAKKIKPKYWIRNLDE